MATYVPDPVFMTRRGVVLLAIIALHVFIAWALATGLARKAVELIAPPIQTDGSSRSRATTTSSS